MPRKPKPKVFATASTLLSSYVGKTGMMTMLVRRSYGDPARTDSPGIAVRVRVVDARMSYGRPTLLIQPTDGEGSAWVRASSVGFPVEESTQGRRAKA